MLLKEILNKKVKYTVEKANHYSFFTRATIGNRDIVFRADHDDEKGENFWYVTFEEFKKSEDGESSTYDITGSGNELEVFSMVKDSLLEFIEKYKPKLIEFTAEKENDSDNRARLYARMLKRFRVSGYTYDISDKHIFGRKVKAFALIRND